MAVIFYFSSISDLKVGSDSVTEEIIWRKLAHVGEYFLLALLLWRIFYYVHNQDVSRSFLYSFLIASLYALSDEFHQHLVGGRAGRVIDVVFDMVSALLALELAFLFSKYTRVTYQKVLAVLVTIFILATIELGMIREARDLPKNDNTESPNFIQEVENIKENIIQEKDKIFSQDFSESNSDDNQDSIPKTIKLVVPFTSQAPFAHWDDIHGEACEEASLIMLKYYIDNKPLTKETAESEIQKMVAYEMKKFGYFEDTTAEQTVELFNEFYGPLPDGKKLKIVYDFSAEDIKKYLSLGNPIIVPAAGRELGNPNFKSPGPLYHQLVLTGYDGNTIITNDPGTRKGENYRYSLKTIYNAIHDFPGKPKDILRGEKAMIIVE